MRTDPTDNGGLFIGRRPGTRPIRYRALPPRGSRRRRVIDGLVAGFLLVLMTLIGASFWGPIPLAWLWVASMVDFYSGSVGLGIVVGFAGMLFTLLCGLVLMRRLDLLWILVRRAGGHDQRGGVVGTIFAVAAAIGVTVFTVWFLGIEGPGPTLAPRE
jgi:hypothetical protein